MLYVGIDQHRKQLTVSVRESAFLSAFIGNAGQGSSRQAALL